LAHPKRNRDMNFSGVWTAIATPFDGDAIDWKALERLLDKQAEGGVRGVIPCGTTGESPTLTHDEKLELIQRVCQLAKGRFAVVAGTGSNNTAETVAFTREVAAMPVDGVMVVTPAYNKPTQRGMVEHFSAAASAAGSLPVMLYNVPGRSAVNLLPPAVAELAAKCSNIKAVKEASGDVIQMSHVVRSLKAVGVTLSTGPDDIGFALLSGDDGLTLPAMAIGATGVVSVASNVAPKLMSDLVSATLKRDLPTAQALHQRVLALLDVLFCESNPIPVKFGLKLLGIGDGKLRLPMTGAGEATQAAVEAALRAEGLL
jgi:4-hydroxy-tetrahydrodipicolinate synthase